MFKLYEMYTASEIDKSNNEGDIIESIGDYISYNSDNIFLTVTKDMEHHRSVRSIDDYIAYVEDYNQRLKNMSCIELKKEIVSSDKTIRKIRR